MNMVKNVCLVVAMALLSAAASAADKLPQTSHDGLQLLKHEGTRVIYGKPGADLSEYDKLAIIKAYVAFKKNWQRDYNEQAGFENRVRDKDIKRIREEVAEEFAKVFADVLSKQGGHALVSQGEAGVLILRPAIIDLEVTAPDMMTASMQDVAAGNAGSLTLYLELLDGASGELLYRIIDAEAAGNDMWRVRNKVTNRADLDRVLRKWAEALNSHLATVKS